jgi:hypothetical protein
MPRPNIQIDNEVREMTEGEYAELVSSGWKEETSPEESIEAQIQARFEARTSASAKLSALGLTEEEINAIIGGV